MNEQEKKRLEMLEASEKKLKDRYKYQNEYIKNNYDKIVLTLPKGFKKEVDNIAKNKGFKNITEYVKELLKNEINAAGGESVAPAGITEDKKPGFFETATNPQQDHGQN